MLHINNPQYADERTASKPLSLEEQEEAVKKMRYILTLARISDIIEQKDVEPIQNLLYHYESLQALSDFIGGWEGARKLTAEWVSVEDFLPEEGEYVLLYGVGDRQFTAIYRDNSFKAYNPHNDWLDECEEVTHWRPLPPKPLVKDKD